MANTLKKEKALKLREKGKSIWEISQRLNVPKSTVSFWCRNIKLGDEQIERLERRQKSGSYKGRMKFLEKVRQERQLQTEALRKKGLKEIGLTSRRDLFVAGIAFYISEGATANCSEEVSVTNSDPRVILLMKRWFEDICGASKNQFTIQVRINKKHSDRVKLVENYWSNLTELPLSQFTKTILTKSRLRKVFSKNNIYYGTARLKVKQATSLRRKISGWIEGLFKMV